MHSTCTYYVFFLSIFSHLLSVDPCLKIECYYFPNLFNKFNEFENILYKQCAINLVFEYKHIHCVIVDRFYVVLHLLQFNFSLIISEIHNDLKFFLVYCNKSYPFTNRKQQYLVSMKFSSWLLQMVEDLMVLDNEGNIHASHSKMIITIFI